MKKTKNVKGYSYVNKNGKTVVVKGYKAEYEAAEDISKEALKKKKGAGDELLKRKDGNDEWQKVDSDWDNLIDSMSDEQLWEGLAEGGYLDTPLTKAESKKFRHFQKAMDSDFDEVDIPKLRQDVKDWFRYSTRKYCGIDEARESLDEWTGKSDDQMSKLQALGLKPLGRSKWIWETKNGSYRLYTQKGINYFLSKFGHLTPREINQLPDSKLVSRQKNKPFDAEGTQKVLDNHKEPAPLVRPTDSKIGSWSRYREKVKRRYYKSTDPQEKERLMKELSVANENMRLRKK